jgi:hypothetical protein
MLHLVEIGDAWTRRWPWLLEDAYVQCPEKLLPITAINCQLRSAYTGCNGMFNGPILAYIHVATCHVE